MVSQPDPFPFPTPATNSPESYGQWCAGADADTAVIEGERLVSYRELRERVGSVTEALRARLSGVSSPGVVLLLPPGLDFSVALLGALDCGLLVIPLDPGLPDRRLELVLADCAPAMVIADPVQQDRLQHSGVISNVVTLGDLCRGLSPAVRPHPSSWKWVVLYTSGSTGVPKGVLLSGDMLIREASTLIERLGIQRADRISHLLSPTVIGGLREILSALLSGATLVPLDVRALGVQGVIRGLERQRVTVCRLVSTLFRSLCHGLPVGHQLAIRRMYIGGEPLLASDVTLFRRHFPRSCRLDNVFGATEFGLCTHFTVTETFDAEVTDIVPIGFANPGFELTVVDAEGRTVPAGETGRLRVAGPILADGYQSGRSLDGGLFAPHPDRPGWRVFQTEDLVRQNSDGALESLGRGDTQAKIRGNRVELGEVENCLLSAADVLDAAVVDLVHQGQSRLYAVVQRGDSPHIDLREWCRKLLSPAAVPTAFIEVASLPRSLQGKCDRRQVRQIVEHFLATDRRPATSPPPTADDALRQTGEQGLLESIWRKGSNLTANDPLDESTPFAGDSITLFEGLLEMRKSLGVEITPAEFREAATLAKLRGLLAQKDRRPVGRQFCVRLTDSGEGPALFLMPLATGEFGVYKHLLSRWKPGIPVYGVLSDLTTSPGEPQVDLARIVTLLANSIQSQQPKGPYLVAGYSFGGVLAFEVARELSVRGGDVAFCGLMDSFLPFASRYQFQLRQLGPLLRNLLVWLPDFLGSGTSFEEVQRWLSRRRSPAGRLANYRQLKTNTQQTISIHMRAMDQHTLNRWPQTVWFYRARVRPLSHSHAIEAQWHRATGAKFESREIPGNHLTMLAPPAVDFLAQALWTDISAALACRAQY